MTVNLLKLCVGIDSVEQLESHKQQRLQTFADGRSCHIHITRFMPKRKEEVLDGGSLYWIIKGFCVARQKIIGLEMVDTEKGPKCAILMAPDLILTESQPRRPHQGWRYLETKDAPADASSQTIETDMPSDMAQDLRDLGLL